MTVPIFIKTYSADFEWLYWCLRSILKFGQAFGDVHIVGEANDMHAITNVIHRARLDDVGLPPKAFFVHPLPAGARHIAVGYMRQQYVKMLADEILLGSRSDRHLQLDSDCFLIREVNPSKWGDPPYWLRTPWDALRAHPDACARQPVLEELLGFSVPYEYMRRHPFMLKHEGLAALRAHLTARHALPLWEIVARAASWSEYNLYGAFCAHTIPELHRWVSTEEERGSGSSGNYPAPCLMQSWSYAAHAGRGIPAETLARYRNLLEAPA